MSNGQPIRGRTPWASQGTPEDPREEMCPRQRVAYTCERGHTFEVTFAAGISAPAAWECRCGKPAGLGSAPEGSEPRPRASRREIQRARVAGAVKPRLLSALLLDYAERFPGCVVSADQTSGKGGGKPRTFVYFPKRDGGIGVTVTPIGPSRTGPENHETTGQPSAVSANIGVTNCDTDPCDTDPVTPIRPAEDSHGGWPAGTIGAEVNRRARCAVCTQPAIPGSRYCPRHGPRTGTPQGRQP
jgi:RNA polymerase-binding protein